MNLQLDHFSDLRSERKEQRKRNTRLARVHRRSSLRAERVKSLFPGVAPAATCAFRRARLVHGPHNVSRWMTWLPISLKNAAKCDMWYQLQNHSITESLNANGAREKPSTGEPRACRNSQCRTTNLSSPPARSRTSVGTPERNGMQESPALGEQCVCVARHAHNVARAGAWCRLVVRVSRRARRGGSPQAVG